MKKRWRAKFSTYDGDKRILAGEVFESETDWSGVFPCLGTIREDMGKEGEEIKKKLDEIYERGIKEMEKEAERKAEDDEILEEDKAEAEKLAEEINKENIETKSEIEAVIDKIKIATTTRGRKRKAEKQ